MRRSGCGTRALAVCFALLAGCGSRTLPVTDGGLVATHDGRGQPPAGCDGFGELEGGKSLGVGRLHAAGFSPDGRLLAVVVADPGNAPAELRVLEVPSLKRRALTIPGVMSFEWAGSSHLVLVTGGPPGLGGLDLIIVDAAAGEQLRMGGTCGHRLSPDGAALFVVSNCAGDTSLGHLCHLDLRQKSCDLNLDGVHGPSLAVSADGKRVAYLSSVKSAGECEHWTGALHEATVGAPVGGPVKIIAPDLASGRMQYLANGALLWTRRTCQPQVSEQIYLSPRGGEPVLVGSGIVTDAPLGDASFAVSPQQDVLLGALQVALTDKLQLFAFRLDGKEKALLADDLFPLMMTEMAFRAWAFAPDGRVVYTSVAGYPAMGLSSLTRQGTAWSKALLSSRLVGAQWLLSPSGKEVAFVEAAPPGTASQLKLADLQSGLGIALAGSTSAIARPRFVPDGRGLVFEDEGAALRYVSRTGGASHLLGEWSSTSPHVWALHPAGCAVVHGTDGPSPGTRLVPLPR